MRGPAADASRPPRHDPQPAVAVTDPPTPGMTPPGQHPRASRTRQPTRYEPLLDRDRVGLYREHRASERNHTALPQQPAKDDSGRAVAYPDPKIVTVTAPINRVNATRPLPSASARSTARTQPCVVIHGGGQHRSRSAGDAAGNPEEILDAVFDFAENLIAQQRAFAKQMLHAASRGQQTIAQTADVGDTPPSRTGPTGIAGTPGVPGSTTAPGPSPTGTPGS